MTVNKRDLQRERTRQRLLDATLRCLVEHGFASTTTQRIQVEAHVSRGALLYHFESKSSLLVAAIHHLADRRLEQIIELTSSVDSSDDPLERLASTICEAMSGPPFQAALELWSGARTDSELRDALLPAERRLGAEIRSVFRRHSGIADTATADLAYESLMALVRGLEITRTMRSNPNTADAVLASWLSYVRTLSPQ